MFPLTRPYRQAVATIGLCALTIAPTMCVGLWAWRINRPGHIRDVEIELGRQLGLQVTLDGVRYPRPGEIVYRGIVVRSEEPRGQGLSEIIRADEIRVQRADRELILLLVNPRLRAETPRLLLSQIGGLLQRPGEIPYERVNVSASACHVDLGQDELRFAIRDLAGGYSADSSIPTVQVAFRMPGKNADTRCELALSRDRRTEPFTTSLTFKTVEGMPLPARVLDLFFDAKSWLGPDAGVDGTLSMRQSNSKDWSAEFQGNLHDIDLGKVIGQRFPRHRLAGRSRLELKKAQWGNRPAQGVGWVEVQGTLHSGPGTIGVSLLEAMANEMRFRISPRFANLDPRKTEVDFRSLGLSFHMRPQGEIQVTGALGEEFPPDAILAGTTTALLSAPRGAASVHGLIKTLFPEASSDPAILVPLTAESQVLLSLPVPAGIVPKSKQTLGGN